MPLLKEVNHCLLKNSIYSMYIYWICICTSLKWSNETHCLMREEMKLLVNGKSYWLWNRIWYMPWMLSKNCLKVKSVHKKIKGFNNYLNTLNLFTKNSTTFWRSIIMQLLKIFISFLCQMFCYISNSLSMFKKKKMMSILKKMNIMKEITMKMRFKSEFFFFERTYVWWFGESFWIKWFFIFFIYANQTQI